MSGVEIGEAHAFTRKAINVRCGDFGTVRAYVGIAEVIAEDENDVWRTPRFVL